MAKYRIFTDSSSDLSSEQRKQFDIPYFRMGVSINGKEYHADLDYQEYSVEQLYAWVGDTNNNCKTSLVSPEEFIEKMRPVLEAGEDILYLACSGSLSSSVNVFKLVSKDLREEFPERKMFVVDACVAGFALGLLAIDCKKKQDEGASIEEVLEFAEKEKQKYNLLGTVANLTYLRQAGRVSGAAAFFGNMMGVKPIIIEDTAGRNYAFEKVNGRKKSLNRLIEIAKERIDPERKEIYLGHGVCLEDVEYMKKRFEEELGAKVLVYPVGPIIGVSCGPGVIHVSFFGKEVTITEPGK